MICLLGFYILTITSVFSQDPECCHRVRSHPACQEACDQMALESSSAGRRQHVGSVKSNCPMTLTPFWHCVNNSAPDIWQEDRGWAGRTCCMNARSGRCHAACMQAYTFSAVAASCVQSDEVPLFQCLGRYEQRESCCSLAPPGTQCRNRCEAVFDHPSPGHDMSLDVEIFCTDVNQQILQCVSNYTRIAVAPPNPRDSLHCCERSTSQRCRETCRRVHFNMTSEAAIINALVAACDEAIIPHDEMWKCFLLDGARQQNSNSAEIGLANPSAVDGAKLQCCSRAVLTRCKEICVKLYSTSWSNKHSWNEFDEYCQYQPTEGRLLTCLADVQEPCQPGCAGLSYCSNFNNRPADMFRSCFPRSDLGASGDMVLWSQGIIRMPFMDIPVLNIAECESDMWKAIACTLQVKPCDRKSHSNMICKADCIHILSKCIDTSRLAKGITAEGLCTILSPTDDAAPCVSLDRFMAPTTYTNLMNSVTFPCNPDPCNNETTGARGICTVDRQSCRYGDACNKYKCSQGCRLGDASSFLVPHGSHVRLPDSSSNLECYQSCVCSSNDILENCQPLRCQVPQPCIVSGQVKEHGAHYKMECNTCICHSGNEICSKRQCLSNKEVTPEAKRHHTGLPCDCSDHYSPVCGANGKTYPNECLAKCSAELLNNQFEFGSCKSKDPCWNNPCPAGLKCVSKRQVCLSIIYAECPQFECVIPKRNCLNEPFSPVCDKDHKNHRNLCTLLNRGKTLAYPAICLERCSSSRSKPVCGHNGHSYDNECEAWADYTTVDYYGPCVTVGKLSTKSTAPQCSTVTCPPPSIPNCIGVVPPGGCCPVCGGQILVLYSETEADRMAAAMGNKAITMDDILPLLRNMVTAAECDLYGYLSIEGDIVLLVVPVADIAADIHIEVCNREAENLEALINSRSPTLVSFTHLSPLLAATTIMPAYNATSAATETIHILSYHSVLLLCFSTLFQFFSTVR